MNIETKKAYLTYALKSLVLPSSGNNLFSDFSYNVSSNAIEGFLKKVTVKLFNGWHTFEWDYKENKLFSRPLFATNGERREIVLTAQHIPVFVADVIDIVDRRPLSSLMGSNGFFIPELNNAAIEPIPIGSAFPYLKTLIYQATSVKTDFLGMTVFIKDSTTDKKVSTWMLCMPSAKRPSLEKLEKILTGHFGNVVDIKLVERKLGLSLTLSDK